MKDRNDCFYLYKLPRDIQLLIVSLFAKEDIDKFALAAKWCKGLADEASKKNYVKKYITNRNLSNKESLAIFNKVLCLEKNYKDSLIPTANEIENAQWIFLENIISNSFEIMLEILIADKIFKNFILVAENFKKLIKLTFKSDCLECLKALIKQKEIPPNMDTIVELLQYSDEYNSVKCRNWLITEKMDTQITNSFQQTFLHLVIIHSMNIANLTLMLELDFNKNAQDAMGKTPLHYALEKRDICYTKLLTDHRVDNTIKDNDGYLPIDIACAYSL